MSNNLKNHIRSTIRRALYGTLGIPMLALPVALAQQATNAPVKLEKMVVTGSLIPTAETVGPAPVDIVGAERIQQVGSQDVLATLKALNPGFAGNVNVGQTVNNGGFGEANLGLRNLATLVLLNGRRLGNSAFSNGAFVDVNTIPLSMIERIEVLKDGASALYGSEAVGGVINIITKKNYNGAEISGRVGFPTESTSNDLLEYRASVVAGASNEKASFTAGAQYYHMDPLLTKDRPLASLGNADRAAMNLEAASYISPSFPGKVQAGANNGTRYLLANSPFLGPLSPTGSPLPGYNPNLMGGPSGTTPGSPPVFPGQTFSGPSAVDNYNAYAIANGYVDPTGNGLGPYVRTSGAGAPSPLPSARLNTTLFGTHSILSQDRRQMFASGQYDLNGKQATLFGEFLYSNQESKGALAPSPVISLFDSRIFVPSNNVYNPFGIDLGPVGGAATPRIRSRFIQSGNRIFDALTDYYHFVSGIKGDFENGYTYNAAYTYNRYDQTQFTRNAVNGAALDLALQPNPDPALAAAGLSKLRDPNGNFVPMYNIFFTPTQPFPTRNGPNAQTTIDAIKTTLYQSGQADEWNMDGSITGEPYELPGGKLAFAIGGGFQSSTLAVDFDGLTQIGKVPGLNSAAPTRGRRDAWAGFVEVRIPVTSPDLNIPGLHSLEITAAGRYTTYDPGGESKVPKLLLRWQPLDEQVTVRGSYSQSFIAPTTFDLFGGAAENNPFLTVGGAGAQLTTVNVSTRTLKPVDAENYGGGIVVSPKDVPGLTVSVDYYHVKTKKDIFRLSEQAMADDLSTNGFASIYAPNFRFDDGSQLTAASPPITVNNWGSLRVPLANGASQETYGLDLAATYQLTTDQWGKFIFYANANVLLSYKYADPTIGGPFQYAGQYTDRLNGIGGGQGLLPDYIINTGVTWEYPVRQDSLMVSLNATYIPETKDPGTLHPAVGGTSNDFTVDGSAWRIDPWYKIDMRVAYEFGKNKQSKDWYDGTTVAVGVSNITDEKPPIIASSFEDNTDKSTYDLLGRFVYFEFAKKF